MKQYLAFEMTTTALKKMSDARGTDPFGKAIMGMIQIPLYPFVLLLAVMEIPLLPYAGFCWLWFTIKGKLNARK